MNAAEFVEETKRWSVRLQVEKKTLKKKWTKAVPWEAEVNFAFTKAKKVVGYAIFDGDRVVWHELFTLPMVLSPAGGSIFIKMGSLTFTTDGQTKTVEQILWEAENYKSLSGKALRSIDDI